MLSRVMQKLRSILAFVIVVPSGVFWFAWFGYCVKQTYLTQDLWFSAALFISNLIVWLSLALLIGERGLGQ